MLILVWAITGFLTGAALNALAGLFAPAAPAPARARRRTAPGSAPASLSLVPASARLVLRRGAEEPFLWVGAALEGACTLLLACVGARWGASWQAVGMAGLVSFFLLLALIDYRYRIVPNVLVFPAAAALGAVGFLLPGANPLLVFLGGALGLGMFGLVAFLRPGQLGYGDVKLAAVIGLLFGLPYVLWALLIGVLAGGLTAICLIVTRRGTGASRMAYAPFLCLGALVALWYNPLPQFIQPLVLRFFL